MRTALSPPPSYEKTLRDDKGAYRLDANTRWGLMSAYYFLDDWSQDNPYPVAQGGANVPGFNALYSGRAQLLDLGNTKTVEPNAVNEFHFSYLRNAMISASPSEESASVSRRRVSWSARERPESCALSPKTEGVESVGFNSFTIGTNTNELKQAGNTLPVARQFSKVSEPTPSKLAANSTTIKINVNAIAQFNGSFLFFGTETGSDFADFLLGIPSQYNQSQLQPFYGRNKYFGLYAQDSWRVTQNLTLNYGLRWDRIEPWYEKYNQIATFEPGKQSVVFPGAPAGILYPTDPGVPRTLAPPGNRDFAPRIGIAYSPSASGDGLLAKILGGPGKTSMRASYGMFYTAIEALTIGVMSANAPYGTTYTSPAPPLFATPFITASNGQNLGQYFPVTLAPMNTRAQAIPTQRGLVAVRANHRPSELSHHESHSLYRGIHVLARARDRGEHRAKRELCRQPGPSASGARRSESWRSGALSELEQSRQPRAGANAVRPVWRRHCLHDLDPRQVYDGTRGPLGSNFGSNANQATIGNSNYNALQITLRHSSKRLRLLAGYTYSKSQDQSSNLGEEMNPMDPSLSRALSAFDVKHNFVVSYSYRIPFETLFRASNRWTEGWEISGITHFSVRLAGDAGEFRRQFAAGRGAKWHQ